MDEQLQTQISDINLLQSEDKLFSSVVAYQSNQISNLQENLVTQNKGTVTNCFVKLVCGELYSYRKNNKDENITSIEVKDGYIYSAI